MRSTSEGVTRVILLRHGASTFNVEGRYQGCCDESVLTQEGRTAAWLSGKRLSSEGIAAVISSPLQRAAETAHEVRSIFQESRQGVSFETDVRLREVELTAWEGLPYNRVKQEFPAQLTAWRLHPSDLRMPSPSEEDAFPVRNLYRRIESFWTDLLAAYTGKSVLLVTHGGTARAMVTSALGLGIDYFQRFQQSNCGISCLSVPLTTGCAKLELLNDTAHLSKALPKLKQGRTGVRLLLITADSDDAEDYLDLSCILERVAIDQTLILSPTRPAALSVFGGHSGTQQVAEAWLERNLKDILETATGKTLSQAALVAPADFVRQFLERYLGLPRTTRRFLDVSGSAVTAIHWPGNGAPAVLQGMNLFERKTHLTGGQV